MEKQGSRTRNVYARGKKKSWTRRGGIGNRITGEIGKWNPRRQRERKKREIDIFQVFGGNAIAKHKENKQVPRVKSGLRRGAPSHGIISEVFINGLASTPIYGMEIISETLLLRSALHPLGTAGHIIFILVHAGRGRAVGAGLVVLVRGVLKLEILDHSVGWGHDLLRARRKDLLQEV